MNTKREQPKTRCGFIDLMRLVFAGLLMIYHYFNSETGLVKGGLYGVEFFVVLSGFLFFSAWDRMKTKSAIFMLREGQSERLAYWKQYILKRYLCYFLYALVAFIPIFLSIRIWRNGIRTLGELHEVLSQDIWEILMIKMPSGFNKGSHILNIPVWTMEVMLFAEFLIMGMLVYIEKPYLTLLMPMSVLVGMGYWMNATNINHATWMGLFTVGALKVYILTCFGIISYHISRILKQYRFSALGRAFLTWIELMGYTWCILAVLFLNSREIEFCFVLVITVTLSISLSGKSNTTKWFPQTEFSDFAAEWSLAIYMIHWVVKNLYQCIYPAMWQYMMWHYRFVTIGAGVLLSLIYLFVMRAIFRLLPRFEMRIKTLLIEKP